MSAWSGWSEAAFARAKKEGKPVLAAVGPHPPEALRGLEEEIGRHFVCVLADPETRPDAAARIGRDRAVVLDFDGARRAESPFSGLAGALERLALEAKAPMSPGAAAPVWTGAVRDAAPPGLPGEDKVSAVFSALAGESGSEPEAVEALLHAAGERGDAAAREVLSGALESARSRWDPSRASLSLAARWAGVFWDAHALTGEARWREAASAACGHLLDALWDPAFGAFRRAGKPAPESYPADGNAFAISALFKAHAHGHPGAGEAAVKALGFLQTRLYDPLLGLQHAAGGEGESVVGLLGDASAAALASTDGFLATGIKAHREFADAMLRFLFQELWERERGGFLDRVPRAGDPAILREPRMDPGLNARALEVCRRMHHLKGNHNYRRWLEWGLAGAWSEGQAGELAGLARVADLHARGRMDFELIGRPGDPKADALLAAVNRLYLPRKVISFVDPDDQDYIMAHRLEAGSYPRVFGCGPDLRRLADAAEPSGVPGVAEAVARCAGAEAKRG